MWTCIPSHSLSPFDRLCGGSLLSGLYSHAAAVPDLNGQFMVVEHGHAQQGGSIRFIGIDESRLPIPRHRHPVGVKRVPPAVGQDQALLSQSG